MRILRAASTVACCLIAVPALGQSAYVTGALGVDVVRASGGSTGAGPADGGNGEVLSGALRLGTSLGDRWGAELEVGLPARLESDRGPETFLLSGISDSLNVPNSVSVAPRNPIVPTFRAERRNVTVSTVAWVRQRVSDSVDLAYLGGLGFYRVTQRTDVSFGGSPLALSFIREALRSRSVTYGVGPVVGMEGRIALTDHVRLVPAVRLHALGSTWLVRPTVGIGWMF